jgi:hypothetical protein
MSLGYGFAGKIFYHNFYFLSFIPPRKLRFLGDPEKNKKRLSGEGVLKI